MRAQSGWIKTGKSCVAGLTVCLSAGWAIAQPSNVPVPPPGQPQDGTGKPSQLFRPQPQAPKIVLPTMFDPAKPIEPMIDAARARARVDGQRVLVALGTDGASFNQSLRDLVATPDMQRLLSMEFVPVWAFAGDGEIGSANRTWAERAEISGATKPDAPHAMLVVLDLDGKKIATSSMSAMVDETRPRSYSTIMVQDFMLKHVAPAPNAKEQLDGALARARSASKGVLISFVDPSNPWSIRWRDLLRQELFAKDLSEVCEVVTVNLVRDKDASTVLERVAGNDVQSVPWFAMLDGQGKIIESSQPSGLKNIGMPTTDQEIARAIEILSSGPKKPDSAWSGRIRGYLVAERERSGR
ncbi:MAG: hypothetical protein K2W85_13275 [Phycisphaerales bacterium]|nr:hypothetical protein [Phycisphaerales bacterium]